MEFSEDVESQQQLEVFVHFQLDLLFSEVNFREVPTSFQPCVYIVKGLEGRSGAGRAHRSIR